MMKYIKRAFIVIVAIIFVASCTNSDSTMQRIFEQEGIVQGKSTGYKFLSCSDGDTLKTGFIGYKNGVAVKGVVCDSIFGFKGATVRYF